MNEEATPPCRKLLVHRAATCLPGEKRGEGMEGAAAHETGRQQLLVRRHLPAWPPPSASLATRPAQASALDPCLASLLVALKDGNGRRLFHDEKRKGTSLIIRTA